MTSTPLLLIQSVPVASRDHLGAQLAIAVAAALVAIGAVGTAVWLGRRVRADAERGVGDLAPPANGPSELTSRHVFRVLQERKIASVEEIAAMSPGERQLLFEAVARKVTPIVGVPTVTTSATAAPALVPKDAPIGLLHCPACGGIVPTARDAARVLANCDGCARRVSARRDGTRVSVTVDDPRVAAGDEPPRQPPRPPSGGSRATRGRS